MRRLHGQEEAPIELLVGIIMFIMVSVLAIQVTTSINNSICSEKLNKAQIDISSNLKSALTGSEFTVQTFSVDIPSCPEKRIKSLNIEKITDPDICQIYCRPIKDTCWMTVLEVHGETEGEIEKEFMCINISPETEITPEDDEDLCNWDKMRRKTGITSTTPLEQLNLGPAHYKFTFKRDTGMTPRIKVCIE